MFLKLKFIKKTKERGKISSFAK